MWARERKIGKFNTKYQATKAKMICLTHGLSMFIWTLMLLFLWMAFFFKALIQCWTVSLSLSLSSSLIFSRNFDTVLEIYCDSSKLYSTLPNRYIKTQNVKQLSGSVSNGTNQIKTKRTETLALHWKQWYHHSHTQKAAAATITKTTILIVPFSNVHLHTKTKRKSSGAQCMIDMELVSRNTTK